MRNQVKKVPECAICRQTTSKYKCPKDSTPYCSVECFRAHKQQADCPGTSAPTPSLNTEECLPHRPASASVIPDVKSAELKPLTELEWPVVDEEKLNVFLDPLRKDEIKPIRQFEWENIATSASLRDLMTNESGLQDLLTRILRQDSSRDSTPPKLRIRQLLQQADGGPSTSFFSPQERIQFLKFSDTVRDILSKHR